MPRLPKAGRETTAAISVLAERPAATRPVKWHQGHGIEVPKGLPRAQPLQTAWLAGAVGALKPAAGSGYVLVSWLSSLKLSRP